MPTMPTLESHIRALRGPVLVTGAAGFIGANLFRRLAAVRSDVFAAVHRGRNWRLAEFGNEVLIAVDLNDAAAVKNTVASLQPQTIFDCSAYGAYSFEGDSGLIYQTNFQAIVNLVSLLAGKPFAAFVHAGSSSEYGAISAGPSEDVGCEPNSHYAVSKVAVASYLRYMGKHHHFPCINLRLYAVYGPYEDTSRLIPTLLRQAVAGKLPPFVDARTSRDFIHVEDACSAFIHAATEINPDLYGESFNIGTGIKTTIADLADMTRTLFNIAEEPRFNTMEGRSWDLQDWYANPQKAISRLGWRPTIDLAEGLRSTAEWISTLSEADVASSTKKDAGVRRRSISAVIACYKDAQAIPHMHRRLTDTFRRLEVDYELIFVNDGSPDDTVNVLLGLSEQDRRVVGISHARNFGSQMAFRSGMELSTKDSVVLLDGDLQDPPELIEQLFAQWAGGADIVYGRRVKREMPWLVELSYKSFYRVFAAFSYVSIPKDAGDFSLMDRRVVEWLLTFPERDLFMRGIRAYVGFRQVGVDYVRPERMFGRSTNNLFKNIEWAKKGIFSFSNAPLTILTTAGVILLAVSLGSAVLFGLLRIFVPHIVPPGITTLLITTLIFGSLNLFALGVVGEYIAKILIEVKARPRLIRSALIRNGKSVDLLPDGKAL